MLRRPLGRKSPELVKDGTSMTRDNGRVEGRQQGKRLDFYFFFLSGWILSASYSSFPQSTILTGHAQRLGGPASTPGYLGKANNHRLMETDP